jgi:hypothetical protein
MKNPTIRRINALYDQCAADTSDYGHSGYQQNVGYRKALAELLDIPFEEAEERSRQRLARRALREGNRLIAYAVHYFSHFNLR